MIISCYLFPYRSVNNNPIAKVGHFMEMETSPGFKRHDTFCWSCHTDGQVLDSFILKDPEGSLTVTKKLQVPKGSKKLLKNAFEFAKNIYENSIKSTKHRLDIHTLI